MRDLAEYFRCDPSYVTSLVDGLESAGLAERRSHPTDRRVKMVALSHSGVDALAQARKILGRTADLVLGVEHAGAAPAQALLAKLDRQRATTRRLAVNALGVLLDVPPTSKLPLPGVTGVL